MTGSLLLVGGRVVDPIHGVNALLDLKIENGKIAEVGDALSRDNSDQVVDVSGQVVMPGIVDSHVHISGHGGGQSGPTAHRMLALAGVTTALDMSGGHEDMLAGIKQAGAGLDVAFVEPIVPDETVSAAGSIDRPEVLRFVDDCARHGAVGVKLLGGHYPITPEEMSLVIDCATERQLHVGIHAGSTVTGSNIEGMEEAVRLAAGRSVHIAHVNAYCRGQVMGDPIAECQRALALLQANPNCFSEAYLSPLNGTSAACKDGAPKSNVVKTCLQTGGFAPTYDGLVDAIKAGWAQIHRTAAGVTDLAEPAEGLRLFEQYHTVIGVSFAVNPATAALYIATARDKDRCFIVDAIGTDGGCIPRNTIVSQGLSLVRFGAWSLAEFVEKASSTPAAKLGLTRKGHFGVGADADVTILDLEAQAPTMSIARGRFVLIDGVVVGKGATVLTTSRGLEYLAAQGQSAEVIRD